MLTTKSEIDRHIKLSLAKLPEHEKNRRGLLIARQYYRIAEYASAEKWVSNYLTEKDDCPQGHKILGQCYEKLKKIDRAISEYQRSLQLDSKQTGLITDVCRLILEDENCTTSLIKGKYWCDLADRERINNDAVLSLKLKLANKDNSDSKLVKDIILKEIIQRPTDVNIRIRLIKYFIDEKLIEEAFKYCFDVEMKFNEAFVESLDWYNTLSLVLTRFAELNNTHQKNWHYWFMVVNTLERQIYLNLTINHSLSLMRKNNIKDVTQLLFEYDQVLKKCSETIRSLLPEKELAENFMKHYRGQLCLHTATLFFKIEKTSNQNRWRETTTKCLPLLLLAYQCGSVDLQERWLKNSNESIRYLCGFWNKQGVFRCTQAHLSIYSSIRKDEENTIINQVRQVIDNKSWKNVDELIAHIRQYCLDSNWRKIIFRCLYTNSDQLSKMSTSYFLNVSSLEEPLYELPNINNIENYEEAAQYLYPSNFSQIVYLGLSYDDLSNFRCNLFNKLNGSTNNLLNCSVETLNQLDIETFLFAAVIEAKSKIECENKNLGIYNYDVSLTNVKPTFLPYPNLIDSLCSEEQCDWWAAVYKLCNNQTIEQRNKEQPRALIEDGLEAVRCVGNVQKIDTIILFKLGQLFIQRSQKSQRIEEKHQLEERIICFFKYALRCIKNSNYAKENIRRFFKYTFNETESVESTINQLSEIAISYLAKNYFRDGKYEEYIEEFNDLDLPYAKYFQAQAYRKLDESSKTPRKSKKIYEDKARESLSQTMMLLEDLNYDKNHSLYGITRSELNLLQYNNLNNANNSVNLNLSYNDGNYPNNDVHQESFHSVSSNLGAKNNGNIQSEKTIELENLILKMMDSLNIAKDDILNIRNDVNDTQDRLIKIEGMLLKIEENTSKKAAEAVVDDVLNDYYILDEMKNSGYVGTQQQQLALSRQQQQQQLNYNQMYNTSYPMYLQQAQGQQQMYGITNQARVAVSQILPQTTYPPSPYQQQIDPNSLLTTVAAQHQAAYFQQQLAAQYLPQYQQQQASVQLPAQQSTPSTTVKPTSIIERALQTPSVLNTWNSTYNNTIVDKSPPVNVVITTSDPLPSLSSVNASNIQNPQPAMSVTIPAQHIKHGTSTKNQPTIQQSYNNTIVVENISPPLSVSSSQQSINNVSDNKSVGRIIESINLKEHENEMTLFNANSKLFIFAEKAWKEHGLGELKIIKNKITGKIRIHMRDQAGATCANHFITPQMQMILQKNQDKAFIFSASDISTDGSPAPVRKYCVRFKSQEIATNFKKKFDEAITEITYLDNNQTVSFTLNTPKTDLKITTISQAPAVVTSVISGFGTTTSSTSLTFGVATSTNSPFFGFGQNTSTPTTVFGTLATNTTNSATTITSTASDVFGGLGGVGKSSNDTNTKFQFGQTVTPKVAPPVIEKSKDVSTKASPFSKFTFGIEKILPSENSFSNIFSTLNTSQNDKKEDPISSKPSEVIPVIAATTSNTANLNKSHNEDEDDYVPTAQFKPVIELPELIATKTGEEDEDCVFEHRAKLLRYIKDTKEWKDRGIGNIKILVNKNDKNKVRLLMRRDQVLKLCCNQLITKHTKFSKKSEKALTWVGHDYSENELSIEMLAIQFKLPETCKEFNNKIIELQNVMTDVQTEETIEKSTVPKEKIAVSEGFGDKFKPKTGSWSCEACYTSNTEDKLYCVSCEAPKDNTIPKKPINILGTSIPTSKFSFGVPPKANTVSTDDTKVVGFGDKFKPKTGSWSCEACYTSNTEDKLYCVSCEAPKDNTIPKKPINILGTSTITSKFSFGVPPKVNTVSTYDTKTVGFGDKFKPKTGSWSCESCYTSNTEDKLYCVSCEAPKDNTVPAKTNNILEMGTITSKFSFGVPPTVNSTTTDETPKVSDTLSTSSKFVFGVPQQQSPITNNHASSSSTAPVFGTPKTEEINDSITSYTFHTPKASFTTPTSKTNESNVNVPTFGIGTEKGSFDFVFKAKPPGKSKSPAKNSVDDDNHTDDEYQEEENNTYFTPAIPLPEKVEVKTGEEDEKLMYSHRAKLFRWTDNEWKERGLGDVKILKHNVTGKLRVVMRREQILKICLNHVLTADIEYKPKDDKTWLFAVQDFSEGMLETMQFCIRFKNADIAAEFKNAIETSLLLSDSTKLNGIEKLRDEAKPTISVEDLKLLEKLRLPSNFFDFKLKDEACAGCRGCNPDNFRFPTHTPEINIDIIDENPLPIYLTRMQINKNADKNSSPIKSVTFSFAEAAASINVPSKKTEASVVKNLFGSPTTLPSIDTKENIFGVKTNFNNPSTGSIFSSSLNTTAASSTTSTITSQSPFSNASPFGALKASSAAASNNLFGTSFSFGGSLVNNESSTNGFNQTDNKLPNIFGGNSNVLAVVDSEKDSIDRVACGADVDESPPKTTNTNPVFGGNPVFATVPSIFAGNAATTATTTSSIFGSSTFSSTESTPSVFGSNTFNPTVTGLAASSNAPLSTFSFTAAFNEQQPPTQSDASEAATPDFLKKDSGLSFASLANDDGSSFLKANKSVGDTNGTSAGGFYGAAMKEDIFSKLANKNKSGNGEEGTNDDSTASATDDNYDPHYEPIIKLPDEIVVSTGEEDELKIFGERAKLFRYDNSTKQWKERGVGELKILHHSQKNTYRLLLRREQIHKLVLNHGVSHDFVMNPMNSSGNAFCWSCMNYAEGPGIAEQLAVRFKNEDLANQFKSEIDKCIALLKSCADLEPEED